MIYNPNSYKGGGMIKRADGSYSQRGLWDNIRANTGSGKKPTKEMLKQEKKIRAAEKKEYGGPVEMQKGGTATDYQNNPPLGPELPNGNIYSDQSSYYSAPMGRDHADFRLSFSPSKGDIYNTPVPKDLSEVGFYRNFVNSKFAKTHLPTIYTGVDHEPVLDYKKSENYISDSDLENDFFDPKNVNWNVQRMIINPAHTEPSDSKKLSPNDISEGALQDIYKYYLLKNKGDREKSWKEANDFVNKRVSPKLQGPVSQFDWGNAGRSGMTGVFDSDNYTYVPDQVLYNSTTPIKDDVNDRVRNRASVTASALTDYLRKYKDMSEEDAIKIANREIERAGSVYMQDYFEKYYPEISQTKKKNYVLTDEEKMAGERGYKNGGMIKRADGSYSQRGVWEKDSKGKINTPTPKGISAGTQPYQDWEHKPVGKKQLTEQEKQIEELRRQQANTQPIGYEPTWQQRLHAAANEVGEYLPGAYSAISQGVAYPFHAIANISQPSKYFEGRQGYNAFLGVGEMATDITALVPAIQAYGKAGKAALKNLYNNPTIRSGVNEAIYTTVDKLSDVAVNNKYLAPHYKKAAYNVMTQSGAALRDWKKILKQSKTPGIYDGNVIYIGDEMPEGISTSRGISNRDLPALYIYGDERGFTQNNLQPIGIEKYTKKYGSIKSYDLKLNSEPNYRGYIPEAKAKMVENIEEGIRKNGIYAKARGNNPGENLGYVTQDDVGGHMNYVYKTPEGNYKLRIQDLWKFDPNDYAKRWASDNKGAIKSRIQARLLEKAGKPFVLSSEHDLDLSPNPQWLDDYITDLNDKYINKIYGDKKYGGTINNTDMRKKNKKQLKYVADNGVTMDNPIPGATNLSGNSAIQYQGNGISADDISKGLNAAGPMGQQGIYESQQPAVYDTTPGAPPKKKKFQVDVKNPLQLSNWNPKGGVNTNDLFVGATSIIAGALPYTPIQNPAPVLPDAINPYPQGIQGSRATYKEGGKLSSDEDDIWKIGMMKAKIATEDAMGNPSAHRMVQNYPQTYTFTGKEDIPSWVQNRPPAGIEGTHYMSSQDNYVVPYIQKRGDKLEYISNASPRDKESMRFNTSEDAEYFANHYKEVAPMMRNWEMKYGGKAANGNKIRSLFNQAPYSNRIQQWNTAHPQQAITRPIADYQAQFNVTPMGRSAVDNYGSTAGAYTGQPLSPTEMDNWNAFHRNEVYNNPEYGTDALNHSGKTGELTTASSFRKYQVQHNNETPVDFGTNQQAAYNANQSLASTGEWGGFDERYKQEMSKVYNPDTGQYELPAAKSGIHIKKENRGKFNATKKRTGKTTEELTHSSNPVTRKRAIFAQNASRWSKKEYGGIVEMDNGGQVQVEENQYEMVSPETMKLKGNYHTDGGVDLFSNGQKVNAERDETVHIDRNGDTVVGGNLYFPGTRTKFKKIFTDIGKQEKKNQKLKSQVTYLSEFDPHNDYTAPIANTAKVKNDMLMRDERDTEATKQYVTDVQQYMLDVAEHTGIHPKDVSKYFSGTAKYGKTMKKGGRFDARYDKLVKDTEGDLQRMYPGKKVEVRQISGYRNPSTQKSLKDSGASQTDVSLHGFGAARDFQIFVDGKSIKDHNVYKNTLWKNAERDSLFHLDPNGFGAKDPGHIGVIQEDGLTTSGRLLSQYPELRNTDEFETMYSFLDNKVKSGNYTPKEKLVYDQISGSPSTQGSRIGVKPPPIMDMDQYYTGDGVSPMQSSIEPITLPEVKVTAKKPNKKTEEPLGSKTFPTNNNSYVPSTYDYDPFLAELGANPIMEPLSSLPPYIEPPIPGQMQERVISPYIPKYDEEPETSVVKEQSTLNLPQGTTTTKPKSRGVHNRFSPMNYLGEFYTMFDQPQPVPSMQVNPILETEYSLSLQNKKNAILSAYRPALNASRNSPAQQAAISAQMAEQLANVDAEELQMNQQNQGAIRARNIQELRGVRDMNTQLTGQQMEKQALAKDNTWYNRQRALTSFGTKEDQRQVDNTRLAMYKQGYGWSMGPQGQYQMLHPDYTYNTYTVSIANPEKDSEITRKKKTNSKGTETTETEKISYFGGKMKKTKSNRKS